MTVIMNLLPVMTLCSFSVHFVYPTSPLGPRAFPSHFLTNINFLSAISICCQEKWLWELNKMITEEKMLWSVFKFSHLILKGNVYKSVWGIWMWKLGLKGLKNTSYSGEWFYLKREIGSRIFVYISLFCTIC